MNTAAQQPELRVDPTVLRDAARHLARRPGPLDLTRLDPGAAGDGATAAVVATFTSSYHGRPATCHQTTRRPHRGRIGERHGESGGSSTMIGRRGLGGRIAA